MINSIDLYLFSVILSLSSLQSFKKHYKSKTQNDKQKTLDMGVSLILIHDSKSALRSVLNVYSERAGFQLADCMLLLCRRRSSQTDWLRGRERERERLCLSLSGRSPLYMRLLPESGAVSCSPLSCREISPPQTLPLKVKLFLLLV